MTPLQYSRRDEQIEVGPPYVVDPTPLVGHWINTNSATTGIARASIAREGGDLCITLWLASEASTTRGEAKNGACYRAVADVVYATGPTATTAMALAARYEDEHTTASLEANLSLGLLVIATCHTFTRDAMQGRPADAGTRSNYFSREFFHYAGTPALA